MNTKAILKNLTSNTPFQDFKMGCKLKIVMYYILLILVELLLLYFVSKKVMQEAGRLFFRLTKSKKWSTYLFAIFFLPGTFIHEASHFLAALILFVPVGQFELIPEFIEEDRLKLGSVPVAKSDFLRRFLIAIAPIIAGLTILFFLPSLLSIHRCIDSWCFRIFWLYLLAGYLVFEVANTMFSSKKDLEGAWIFFLVLILGFVILKFLGINLSIDAQNPIWQSIFSNAKQLSILLLIPIAIDALLLSLHRGRTSVRRD
jgi:hypothetical protein